MILSDYDLMNAIRNKRIVIRPFDKETLRENGIDLRITDQVAHHNEFKKGFVLDPANPRHVRSSYRIVKRAKNIVIGSREQVLLSTNEYVELPDDVMGFVEIRSTWARHGLSMPPTIIDAGFKGDITLEVINNAPYAIALRPKQRLAHIIFEKVNNRVDNVYSGRYLGQRGIRIPKVIKWESASGKDR
ncbi:MAG: dCTP deaminase [Candidatus Marsarchaeota archaeon]|jgi:dCTP deaminase|nr:dCTP deaminase [Candidatus Marsarchaeota archaeon]MCL5111860.1 dCTP deaminase [Candidatus Marsarchaeota archaeon]